MMSIRVYRYRVKSLTGLLNKQARAVNTVWNYCNDAQKHALKWGKKWPSGFDLNKLTTGSSQELCLHSGTINAVCERYAKSRSQFKRPFLRYRSKKSLGWVPFKGRNLKLIGKDFSFHSKTFRVFYSRPLPQGKIKDGSCFAQDAKGNWYLNIVIEIPDAQIRQIKTKIGIDLGLKTFASFSNGEDIPNPRFFRTLEDKLAMFQRARKKRQVTNIHAKIRNCRNDFLHKLSTRLVKEFDYIAVGNVNSKALAKTNMAKSVHDAAWSSFRMMLRYKAITHGTTFKEVNEAYSSQTCSACGHRSNTVKGLKGLSIREWICSNCDTLHNRDTNAAVNILRSEHRTPVFGSLAL